AERRIREEIDRIAHQLPVELGQQRAKSRRFGYDVGCQTLARGGVGSGEFFVVCQAVDQLEQAWNIARLKLTYDRRHDLASRSRMTRPAGGLGWKYVDFSGMRSFASATASTPLTGVGFRNSATEARPRRTAWTASCGSR